MTIKNLNKTAISFRLKNKEIVFEYDKEVPISEDDFSKLKEKYTIFEEFLIEKRLLATFDNKKEEKKRGFFK